MVSTTKISFISCLMEISLIPMDTTSIRMVVIISAAFIKIVRVIISLRIRMMEKFIRITMMSYVGPIQRTKKVGQVRRRKRSTNIIYPHRKLIGALDKSIAFQL